MRLRSSDTLSLHQLSEPFFNQRVLAGNRAIGSMPTHTKKKLIWKRTSYVVDLFAAGRLAANSGKYLHIQLNRAELITMVAALTAELDDEKLIGLVHGARRDLGLDVV